MRFRGYRPSTPEPADYPVERLFASAGISVKESGSADLSYQVVQILDQGPLGSCVFCGISQMIRMRNRADVPGSSPPLPSRLFAYYCARDARGEVGLDVGSDPKTAINAIRKFGCLDEHHWPYVVSKFDSFPGHESFRLAYDQRAFEYYFVRSFRAKRVEDCKLALDAGFAIGIGTLIGKEFDSWKAGDPPLGPPNHDDPSLGGHFTVLDGYSGDSFRDLNSWGTGWGDHGRAWLSSDYIEWPETTDLVVLRRVPTIPARTV